MECCLEDRLCVRVFDISSILVYVYGPGFHIAFMPYRHKVLIMLFLSAPCTMRLGRHVGFPRY